MVSPEERFFIQILRNDILKVRLYFSKKESKDCRSLLCYQKENNIPDETSGNEKIWGMTQMTGFEAQGSHNLNVAKMAGRNNTVRKDFFLPDSRTALVALREILQ